MRVRDWRGRLEGRVEDWLREVEGRVPEWSRRAEALAEEALASVGTITAAQRAAGSVVYEPKPVRLPPTPVWLGLSAACGVVLLVVGGLSQPPRPPQPHPQSAVQPVAGAAPARAAQPNKHAAPNPPIAVESKVPKAFKLRLARSEPTRLEIPSIGVKTELLSLGVDAKNEVAVPPLDRAELASWYNLGPSPGELGSAVIVGHVDSEKIGPAVFFNLGRLQPGETVHVHRRDGVAARFVVESVQSFPKANFPTELVYGGHDRAMLRLVTCGGDFDRKSKNYLSNVVVFANLAP